MCVKGGGEKKGLKRAAANFGGRATINGREDGGLAKCSAKFVLANCRAANASGNVRNAPCPPIAFPLPSYNFPGSSLYSSLPDLPRVASAFYIHHAFML